jgi:acyl carrier protein
MRDDAATRDAFNRALIDFVTRLVRARSNAADAAAIEIDASTPLFETGLIDSLGVLELLAFLEERTGRPIPIHQIDVAFLQTVQCMSRSFWHGAPEQTV